MSEQKDVTKENEDCPRCEGWRRYGGIFTLGPVRWEQCKNKATVMLDVIQQGKRETLPACQDCWKEVIISDKIEIIKSTPL